MGMNFYLHEFIRGLYAPFSLQRKQLMPQNIANVHLLWQLKRIFITKF